MNYQYGTNLAQRTKICTCYPLNAQRPSSNNQTAANDVNTPQSHGQIFLVRFQTDAFSIVLNFYEA